ncbi:MAG: tetratricopeptide repeat protein [Candidatus Xenobia bacterium]
MKSYEIRLLGAPLILDRGEPIHLNYQRATALLAYIAAEGHAVTRERLRTLLWEESDERRAGANLRHALHEIRTALPDVLQVQADQVGLDRGRVQIDLDTLENATEDPESVFLLRRGPFCEGLLIRDSNTFDEWLSMQRLRWDTMYLNAVMALSEKRLQQGNWEGAMAAAQAALSTDSLHEPAHAQVIRLLLARGETTAAHRQLQECQRLLSSELGVELSQETLSLFNLRADAPEQMLETFFRAQEITPDSRQKLEADLRALPRERVVGAIPGATAQHFKDRKVELAALHDALSQDNTRLIVVSGPGGLGKTAVVTRFLHDIIASDAAPESIIYLTLRQSEFWSPDHFIELMCRTLEPEAAQELRRGWQEELSLAARLEFLFHRIIRMRRWLLVLDNFEIVLGPDNRIQEQFSPLRHFIDAAVEWDHGLRMLVISRRSLMLEDDIAAHAFERHVELAITSGLPEDEAVELLRELDTDGTLGLRDAPGEQLHQVARRCHGIPRTLESLAGLLRKRRTLTLDELMADDVMLGRVAENPARELYESLNPEERLIVQALAVYDRPVPAAALRFVLPGLNVNEDLENLVRNHTISSERGQFWQHRLNQRYAWRQIPEGSGEYSRRELHARAAGFYRAIRKPETEWKSIDDLEAPLAEFHHLVRAGQFEVAGELINKLEADYLSLWGHISLIIELRSQLTGHLQTSELDLHNIGRLGVMLRETGEYSQSLPYLEQALGLARKMKHAHAIGVWLCNLGLAQGRLGDWQKAVTCFEETLEIAGARGYRSLEGNARGLMGKALENLGDLPGAIRSYEQAVAIEREIHDRRREGVWLEALSRACLAEGDADRALQAATRAYTIAKSLGHRPGVGAALCSIGKVKSWQGHLQASLPYFRDALRIARQVRVRAGLADTLEALGLVWHRLGNVDEARRCYEEAMTLDIPSTSYSASVMLGVIHLAEGRGDQGLSQLEEAQRLCRALLVKAPNAIRCLYHLALAELAAGREANALQTFQQALKASSARGIVTHMRCLLDLLPTPSDRASALLDGAIAVRRPRRARSVARG